MKKEFLEKARENLKVAEICFDKGFYNVCASRCYYAVFQSALVALTDRGLDVSRKSHKWVQATFSEELIKKRKIYPKRFKSHLMTMQMVRNQADYTVEPVSYKTASRKISKAKDFVKATGEEYGL